MDSNIFAKANKIIKNCDAAYLGVIDENGFPSVSTVSVIGPENIFEAYFSTNIGSNKEKRLQKNNRASICYREGGNNITLVGDVEILTDQPTKSRFWIDWFIDHYSGGETDPNYCIIKFTTKRVSLWVENESAEFMIEELLTVQSRCGLLCKWCPYKKSHNCGGCVETNGNPFHGECPVAKCCQDKGFAHCGECVDLPGECADPDCRKIDANGFYECGGCKNTSCDKLFPYSYKDPDHGDNPPGARVEVCKAWAAQK
jgi:general stress protein 26